MPDFSGTIKFSEQKAEMKRNEMALGPIANDFSYETTVKDHLTSKREDVDLDVIFEGESNIGYGIGEAPNVFNW